MTTLRTDSTHSGITIDYANGSGFVHGGSGPLTVYSDDEKAAINALTDANDDTYYLFLVKNVTKLDANGNRTIVSGYMPVGYQHGFIFEQFDVARTIAHVPIAIGISHGAFALHHTFSANTESFHADEGTTNNLMDYTEHGATLNHKQWTWMHEKHGSGLFGFLADEEEGEATGNAPVLAVHNVVWDTLKENKEGLFITPSGEPIYLSLKGNAPVAVMKNAVVGNTELRTDAIYGFEIEGTKYMAEIQGNTFNGYFKVGEKTFVRYEDEQTSFKLVDKKIFKALVWNIDSETFVEKNWIMYDKEKEYLFYDKTNNKIVIVTDITDLHWLNVSDELAELSEIQNPDVSLYSEKELFDLYNKPLTQQTDNKSLCFYLLDFQYNVYISTFLDVLCDAFISLMFTKETEECMRDFWNENRDDFIHTIIDDKRLFSEVLSKIADANISGVLNALSPEFNKLFKKQSVIDKMSECLATYAQKKLCHDVDIASLSEQQKQDIFKSDARQTVGVLLYEFATGEGPDSRVFDCTNGQTYPFVTNYLRGRISKEIRDDLLKYLSGIDSTLGQFMNGECFVNKPLSLELTPGGDLSGLSSIGRHITSNLEQLFVGGALVETIEPVDKKSLVKVKIFNVTGMQSLFLHMAEDVNRTSGTKTKLSNIRQEMVFYMDLNKEYKEYDNLSDIFTAADNIISIGINGIMYICEQRLKIKLTESTFHSIINTLKKYYDE